MLRDGAGAVKGWESKAKEALRLGCPSLRLPWLWPHHPQEMGVSGFQAAADGSFRASVKTVQETVQDPQQDNRETQAQPHPPSELTCVRPSLLHSDFVVWLSNLPLPCKPRAMCASEDVPSGDKQRHTFLELN